jgi:hypothetical protein
MINHLLKQDCGIIKIERDRFGGVTESDPIPTKCRATESFEWVRNGAGEEVVSSITFWLNPDVDIDMNNIDDRRIEYNGKSHNIISVRNRRNSLGEIIFKVVSV